MIQKTESGDTGVKTLVVVTSSITTMNPTASHTVQMKAHQSADIPHMPSIFKLSS